MKPLYPKIFEYYTPLPIFSLDILSSSDKSSHVQREIVWFW